ncbi:MAG: D-alanine--D-alanine ligase family protein [Candidatus Promineifilaceae bacterium]|jgi:D-alanine-D-alanine ligase
MMNSERIESTGRKIRVGVMFGGRSGEHEVSLMSASSVMSALDREKYDVLEIGITRSGQWLAGPAMAQLQAGDSGAHPATLLPDPSSLALLKVNAGDEAATRFSEVSQLDVVLPILHGTYGEDGTVQGLLELADLPYVGAGVVGSAVGMDKAIFKYVMEANDIPIVDWCLVTRDSWRRRKRSVIGDIEVKLNYPVFTKPANLGSSVGINKCNNRAELSEGIDEAFQFDRRVVVEQGINARELEVAVLGNEDPIASIVGEIRPRREFYDYVAKYMAEPGSDDESELLIPAEIDKETSDLIRALAVRAYKAIDCAGMGRVDLMMDRDSGELFMNEINTIPGFTRISMYPKLWEATGLSYPELLDRLIELAIERHEEKSVQKTNIDIDQVA